MRAMAMIAMVGLVGSVAHADEPVLPDPLTLDEALAIARRHRAEIAAAQARARAAAERPAIAGSLDDPMILPSLDHLPVHLDGADWSVVVEQRFPLSHVRSHRRQVAEAIARGERARSGAVALDVELQAATAFVMLREQRQMATITREQYELAERVVAAANALYGAGKSTQAEVLRAEIEVARLTGESAAATVEVAAAAIMLNTSLGRAPELAVPELAPPSVTELSRDRAIAAALASRPELRFGRTEVERAGAELAVMHDMFKPMAMIQSGPSYTMSDGVGWMVMVGISIPLYRDKLRAGVREAEAMRDMASNDLRAMERMVIGDAAVARDKVIAARIRWLALRDQVVPKARAAIDPMLAAYSAGQLPLVSVLEATRELWMTRIELVAAERELGLAIARLRRAIGSGGTS